MAHQLKMDPVTLRRRWDPNPARKLLYDWVGRRCRRGSSGRARGRRGGFAAGSGWRRGLDVFRAAVGAGADRRGPDGIVVSTACQDIGNGTRTVLAKVVGEVLGVAPASMQVRDRRLAHGAGADGGREPHDGVGRAGGADAAELLRDELVARGGGAARRARGGGPGRGEASRRACAVGGDPGVVAASRSFIGDALARPRRVVLAADRGGLAAGKYMAGALHVFEVEVDTRLGDARAAVVHGGGSGKIMTPALARSQVQGGVTQAISYALYEERRLDPRSGMLLTGGLEDYRIAGLGDVGEAEVHFEEDGFENAGAGGVGLAELIDAGAGGGDRQRGVQRDRAFARRAADPPDRVLAGSPRHERRDQPFPDSDGRARGGVGGRVELRAGGTDLQERRHLRLSRGPVVDLRDMPGLGSSRRGAGLHIGARTRIAALAGTRVQQRTGRGWRWRRGAGDAGDPQPGDDRREPAAEVRCWYFRRPGARCFQAGRDGL
jgi:hypothetical protein